MSDLREKHERLYEEVKASLEWIEKRQEEGFRSHETETLAKTIEVNLRRAIHFYGSDDRMGLSEEEYRGAIEDDWKDKEASAW